MSIVSRVLRDGGLGDMTQVYLRIGLASLIFIIVFHKKINLKNIITLSLKDYSILILMGLVGYALAVYFVTMGALNTSLINVSVIFSTMTFFAYIYGLFIGIQRLSLITILLILVSVLGVSLISSGNLIPNFTTFNTGDLYVLLAAASMAWLSVGRQWLTKRLNNYEITAIITFIAFIASFAIALLKGETLIFDSLLKIDIILALAVGTFSNIFTTFSESYAFERIDLVLGNQILLLENPISVLFGYFIYSELITVSQLIGIVIILAAVLIKNRVKTEIYIEV